MSFHIRPIQTDPKPRSSLLCKAFGASAESIRSYIAARKAATEQRQHERQDERRLTFLKTSLTVSIAVLFTLAVVAGAFKGLLAMRLSMPGLISMAGAELPKDNHGFTNILLLGDGGDDHDGVDLTDTIMVVSLDPNKTHSAVMLSLPRDLYVLRSDKMGAGRINSLYRNYKYSLVSQKQTNEAAKKASLNQLTSEIGKLIDLEIHGAVKITFAGFEQAIDAIGGIDIDVPSNLVDNLYPGPNYSYVTFAISKGLHHMDGKTALKYARSRHSTSDFSRSARQQQIIAAAGKQISESGLIKNISRMTELMGILSDNIDMTFTTREIISLASLGRKIDHSSIINIQLNDRNGLYGSFAEPGGFLYAPPREEFDGASVLLPVSMPAFPVTWKQIQTLSSMLFLKRGLFIDPPRIAVLNTGAKEGMARRLGSELSRYGFQVIAVRNYDKGLVPPVSNSFIAIVPSDIAASSAKPASDAVSETIEFISEVLSMQTVSLAAPVSFTDEPDIVIALGKEYTYSPLQNLMTETMK